MLMSAFTHVCPGPTPMVISNQWIQNLAQCVSQPIRNESDDVMSG